MVHVGFVCIFRQLQVLKIETTYIDTLPPEKSLRRVLIAGSYVGMITRSHKEINGNVT